MCVRLKEGEKLQRKRRRNIYRKSGRRERRRERQWRKNSQCDCVRNSKISQIIKQVLFTHHSYTLLKYGCLGDDILRENSKHFTQ